MKTAERTLDVFIEPSLEAWHAYPSDIFKPYLERVHVKPAEVVAADELGIRQAADLGATMVILASRGQPPSIELLGLLASKNPTRDSAGRRLRLHLLVPTGSGRSLALEWLDSLAAASRGRRIVVWLESAYDESSDLETPLEPPAELATHASRVLGVVRFNSEPGAVEEATFEQLDRILGAAPAEAAGLTLSADSAVAPSPAPAEDLILAVEARLQGRLDAQDRALDRVLDALRWRPVDIPKEMAQELLRTAADHYTAGLTDHLRKLEAKLGEAAEQRFATRLEGLANTWAGHVKSTVVDATSLLMQRSNAAFGERAEHFTRRLETFAHTELDRDRRFSAVAANETSRTLRDWLEPQLGSKTRWFGIGAAACSACLVAGLVAGALLQRVLG